MQILTASLLTYSVLRTLSLQLLSVVTGSYVSGTYSIVFVNCPNEQIARDIARYGEGAQVLPQGAQEAPEGPLRDSAFAFDNPICPVLSCTAV